MGEVAERFEHPAGSGLTVVIEYDYDLESPREAYDNLGTMIFVEMRDLCNPDARNVAGRYQEPDNGLPPYIEERKDYPGYYADKDEIICWEIAQHRRLGNIVLPLSYVYYGSGQSRMYVCDDAYSRCNGYIYVTREQALKECGGKILTAQLRKRIEGYLRNEVETYSQFIEGDVYLVRVRGTDDEDNEIAVAYGMDEARTIGKEMAEETHARLTEQRARKLADRTGNPRILAGGLTGKE